MVITMSIWIDPFWVTHMTFKLTQMVLSDPYGLTQMTSEGHLNGFM